MVDATISRGGTTVTLPLLEEGGNVLVTTDWGKPNAQTRDNGGSINPRAQDQWSGLANYNLFSRLEGSSAFSDAITLADLIKEHSGGTALTLNVGMNEFDTDISCMPGAGQASALTLTYEPGRTNTVFVELSLTRISGIDAAGSQSATTPTASGSGPITFTANNTSVPASTDMTVVRNIGRPKAVVRRTPAANFPLYYDKRKIAHDSLEFAFQFLDNPVSDLTDLADNIFKQQLGRSGMTVDFQGLYGMGSFDVLPTGSAPFRNTRIAGQGTQIPVPTFEFRRIRT